MRASLWLLLSLALFTLLWRVFPHPMNMTPLAALALVAGARATDVRVRYALPLLALFVSDLILGLHATMAFVYGSMALVVLLGGYLQGRGLVAWAGASVASSLLFFVITNFGVWLVAGYYPLDLAGLVTCYVVAIPFLWKTMAGDLFFVAAFFGSFALLDYRAGVPARSLLSR